MCKYCTANVHVGVLFSLQDSLYEIVPGLRNPRMANKSFGALIIQVLHQIYYMFLYFEFRCLFFYFALSEHLKFPFYVANQKYIRNPLFVVSRRCAFTATVCRHCGFYSTAAPRGLIYFLNPAGNPTKQQMHLSNVKARPSNAARITP